MTDRSAYKPTPGTVAIGALKVCQGHLTVWYTKRFTNQWTATFVPKKLQALTLWALHHPQPPPPPEPQPVLGTTPSSLPTTLCKARCESELLSGESITLPLLRVRIAGQKSCRYSVWPGEPHCCFFRILNKVVTKVIVIIARGQLLNRVTKSQAHGNR